MKTRDEFKVLFGEIAVKENFISLANLEEALKEQRSRKRKGQDTFLGQILLTRGDLTRKQISTIFDIQKQLCIQETITLGESLEKEAIRKAHRTVLIKKFIPLGMVLVFGILFAITRVSDKRSMEKGMDIFQIQGEIPQPMFPLGEEFQKGPEVTQFLLGVVTRNQDSQSFSVIENRLDQLSLALIFDSLCESWALFSGGRELFLGELMAYLFRRNSPETTQWVYGLLEGKKYRNLGWQVMGNSFSHFRGDEKIRPIIGDALISEDVLAREMALTLIEEGVHPLLKNWEEILWTLVVDRVQPHLGKRSLKILYGRKERNNYDILVRLLPQSHDLVAREIVLLLLKNEQIGFYSKLYEIALDKDAVQESLIRYLKIFSSKAGEKTLIDLLNSPYCRFPEQVIRALGFYHGDKVVASLVDQFDKRPDITDEIVKSLRLASRKNFGYRFGESQRANQEALSSWKSLRARLKENGL